MWRVLGVQLWEKHALNHGVGQLNHDRCSLTTLAAPNPEPQPLTTRSADLNPEKGSGSAGFILVGGSQP